MYYKPTFFSTLKNNLSCLFCRKKKNCSLKYMPGRRKSNWHDGTDYVQLCPKEKEKIFKKVGL